MTNEKFFHMPHQQPASVPLPALPVGWSKTLSNGTGATYYVKKVRCLCHIYDCCHYVALTPERYEHKGAANERAVHTEWDISV